MSLGWKSSLTVGEARRGCQALADSSTRTHQISAGHGWQQTIPTQHRIKELGLSQGKVLKTQRRQHLDKSTWLEREMHGKEEKRPWVYKMLTSLRIVKCLKGKENVQLTSEFQSRKGWKLCVGHSWRGENGAVLLRLWLRLHLCFQGWSVAWVPWEAKHRHMCGLAEHHSLVCNARFLKYRYSFKKEKAD